MFRTLTFFIIVSICAFGELKAQAYSDAPYSPRSSFGLYAGGGLNIHSGGFADLPQLRDCCPEWTTGSGLNLNVGLFYALPISESFELSIDAQYNSLSGSFEETETRDMATVVGLGSENANVIAGRGTFNYKHDATLNSIGGVLGIAYRITDQLRIKTGFRVGTLLSPSSTVTEELTENQTLIYRETGTQQITRLDAGELDNTNTVEMSLLVGGSYDLPLSDSYEWFLVPMVNYTHSFSPIVNDLSWNVHTFSGGLGIRYAPRELVPPAKPVTPPPPPPPPPLPAPPPPPVTPNLDAEIKAVAVDENGNESDISLIKVEENYQIRTHPLLNFVFFEHASPNLPTRYASITEAQKKTFSFREFYDIKTMDVYHNILNIVGKRMEFYPQSTIRLVGTNSGEDEEKDNIGLSRTRAQAVKNYLTQEWGIDASRITIDAVNLPDNPSNRRTQDGIEENRRVEMYSNIPQIFEPMIIRDTVRTSNPPYIRFKPTINSAMGIKSWKIITSQDGRDLKTFSGTGTPPANINWFAAQEDEQEFIPKLDEPLDYRMEVVDNDGKKWTSKNFTLPVDQITIQKKIFEGIEDKIYNKFSMIGFPYNSAEIIDRNEDMLESVRFAIEDGSEIFIYGYSDRLGDDDYNMKLAQRRADAVGKALSAPSQNITSYGESRLLYDNELPEGRFYSRTVIIDVITTIQ